MKYIPLVFAVFAVTAGSAQAYPEGSVAHRMRLYDANKGSGGYHVVSPDGSLDRIYVRAQDGTFHALRMRQDGSWYVNNWVYGERQAQMLLASGNYIDLNDPASNNITLTFGGKTTVLRGDGTNWRTGGGSSSGSSSGADVDDQDTGTVGGNGQHTGSDPLCRLTGSCGSSSGGGGGSSTSGGGSSSGGSSSSSSSGSSSSSSSSGGGQFTPIGELTVSGNVPCEGGVRVTSAAQAQSAVSGSATCVILANGNYGKLSLNQPSGTVVVKAENLLGAKLSGLSLSGSGITVSGVDINGGIQMNGSNLRVSRCVLKGNISGKMFDATVDRCDISGYFGTMMRLGPPSQDIMFTRNYVHDSGGNDTFHNAPKSVLDPGMTNTHREHSMRFIASYNFIERHNGNDFWHAKSSDNVFAFNHVIPTGYKNEISLRHGRNNKIIGNYAPGVKIGVRDYNAVVLGNNGRIQVFGGDIDHTFDNMLGKHQGAGYSTQPPARNVRIAGNVGTIELGTHYAEDCSQDPQPAENIEIYDHSGSITNSSATCITWYKNISNHASEKAPASWGAIPEPVKLAKSDVGPNAN